MDRCKAHGLSHSFEHIEQDDRVSIHSSGVLFTLTFSFYKEGNNFVVESRADKYFLLADPAPIPLFPVLGYIGNKLSLMYAKRILKTIHSEINNRFT